jgi:hypothetical protein
MRRDKKKLLNRKKERNKIWKISSKQTMLQKRKRLFEKRQGFRDRKVKEVKYRTADRKKGKIYLKLCKGLKIEKRK